MTARMHTNACDTAMDTGVLMRVCWGVDWIARCLSQLNVTS